MPARRVVRVTPRTKGGWKVEHGGRAELHETKAEAVTAAKRSAQSAALGQVVVHKRDGKVQTEYTYGKDPRSSPG